MKVLYVNHTSTMSGAERSLLDLVGGLPTRVRARVACPSGPLATAAQARAVPTAPLYGTKGSLRLHPLHTPRALAEMSLSAAELRRAVRRHRPDIVHANTLRAGIVTGLAGLDVPAVVHIRDCLPPSPLSRATLRLIASRATVVVANSAYTASAAHALAPGSAIRVIHSPVDLARYDPARIDRAAARARLGIAGQRRLLLGVAAQLTPWKGQDTAVRALAMLREEGVDAHLLLIGSAKFVARATRFDNAAFAEKVRALVSEARLEDRVSWLGEREDVPELMRALDVLVAPSSEEPFGRTVIEAMALGVPVVATNVGGPAEIIRDGRDGYLLPPAQPRAWALALSRLASDPQLAASMGREARTRVRDAFTLERHVASVLDAYEWALAAVPRRRAA